MSDLTQVSKALDGVGGRRSHDPACCWTTLATLKVDPSKARGSAIVGYYAGKLVMLPFYQYYS